MKKFPERLKALRKEKNLSQEALSSDLSIPRTTLSSWESGSRNPELAAMIGIADYFGVSIDYLVGRTEIRNLELSSRVTSKLSSIILEDTELLQFLDLLSANIELQIISKQIRSLSPDSLSRLIKVIKAIEG